MEFSEFSAFQEFRSFLAGGAWRAYREPSPEQEEAMGEVRGIGRPSKLEQHARDLMPHEGLDDWIERSGYSPDKFYVAATNKHDHYHNASLRIPQNLWFQLGDVVSRPEFPAYRTPLDLIRDALVHRLVYLQQRYEGALTEDLKLDISMAMMRARMTELKARSQELHAIIDDLNEQLDDAKRANDWLQVEQLVSNGAEMLESGNWPPVYRKKFAELIEKWEHRLGYVEDGGRDDGGR